MTTSLVTTTRCVTRRREQMNLHLAGRISATSQVWRRSGKARKRNEFSREDRSWSRLAAVSPARNRWRGALMVAGCLAVLGCTRDQLEIPDASGDASGLLRYADTVVVYLPDDRVVECT